MVEIVEQYGYADPQGWVKNWEAWWQVGFVHMLWVCWLLLRLQALLPAACLRCVPRPLLLLALCLQALLPAVLSRWERAARLLRTLTAAACVLLALLPAFSLPCCLRPPYLSARR